ncbi:MAG: cytidine deaminase [Prevotellaceae bacterium]|jgi:cytidine deaminase|nr:cytidine deaminase [Prevotellaceae bacterium]
MRKEEIKIGVAVYDSLEELSSDDKLLVVKAKEATVSSYSPYSNFMVGTAVLLDNGEVIIAGNQENVSYPAGLCAERVALFYAGARHPNVGVKAIAIAAQTNGKFCEHPVYPCGACRQVMLETEMRTKHPMKVIMAGEKEVKVVDGVKDLMPFSFDSF